MICIAIMARPRRDVTGPAVTALILEVFRLNGRLLAAGDRLVAKLGLTSARWQVLGAIALSPSAEPVARLARNMGLHRQGDGGHGIDQGKMVRGGGSSHCR